MICNDCGKAEAVVHITVANTGERVDLCLVCSEKMGADKPAGINLSDLIDWLKPDKGGGSN